MQTFKQYIAEIGVNPFAIPGKPAWTESLSTMLFDLPRAGIKDVKIPLSPAIMRRIWPKPVRTTVFHLTDYNGLEKLKKMQGGKRSVSAFFNIEPIVIETGIKSEGGYVIEMDADILIASQDDISSQPDKTGRRWVTLSSLMNKPTDPDPGLGGGAKLRGMKKDIEKMLWGIIKTHAEYPESDWSIDKAWMELRTERVKDGKIMSLIIKDYLDGMEKVMKRHSKGLKKVFYDYLKKRDKDGTNRRWDEIVVNNIKIKMLHSAEYGDYFDDIGIPVKKYGWEDGELVDMDAGNKEIAAYVAKKSQQLARKK